MRSRTFARFFLLVVVASPGRASTLRVGAYEDYPTIQAAVDSAASGDTLLLAPEVFQENPLVREKDLTLRSAATTRAVLDAGPFSGVEGNGGNGLRAVRSVVLLEDLEIRNARPMPLGAGVLVWGGSAILRRCVLRDNVFGIQSFEPVPGTISLEDCEVLNNGVGILGYVSTEIVRTRIEGNWLGARLIGFADLQDVQVTDSGRLWVFEGEPPFPSGGLILPGGVGRLQRVEVRNNHSTWGTSCIWVEEGPYELVDCICAENHSEGGPAGFVAVRATQLSMESCTARDNFSRGAFYPTGGLLAYSSRVSARRCRFEGNDSGLYGGGVAALRQSEVQLQSCQIIGNRTLVQGGGIYAGASRVTMDSVVVLANTAADGGGGVFLDPGGHLEMRRSTMAGNEARGGAALFVVEGTASIEQSIVAFHAERNALFCFGDVSWRCSDLYANGDAELCGRDLGGNVSLDPGFCRFDPARALYDVSLQEDSPLLTNTGCGGIGAAAVGCQPTGLRSVTWGELKGLFR